MTDIAISLMLSCLLMQQAECTGIGIIIIFNYKEWEITISSVNKICDEQYWRMLVLIMWALMQMFVLLRLALLQRWTIVGTDHDLNCVNHYILPHHWVGKQVGASTARPPCSVRTFHKRFTILRTQTVQCTVGRATHRQSTTIRHGVNWNMIVLNLSSGAISEIQFHQHFIALCCSHTGKSTQSKPVITFRPAVPIMEVINGSWDSWRGAVHSCSPWPEDDCPPSSVSNHFAVSSVAHSEWSYQGRPVTWVTYLEHPTAGNRQKMGQVAAVQEWRVGRARTTAVVRDKLRHQLSVTLVADVQVVVQSSCRSVANLSKPWGKELEDSH